MVKKAEQQIAAQNLRRGGKSIKAIARQLEVSVSSVTRWTRGVELTPEQKKALMWRDASKLIPRKKGEYSAERIAIGEEAWKARHTAKKTATSKAFRERHPGYFAEQRERLKAKLIEYKGGGCETCGYDKCPDALTFHHLDPAAKEFTISKTRVGWDKLVEEADKCQMLCANCHAEVHWQLRHVGM